VLKKNKAKLVKQSFITLNISNNTNFVNSTAENNPQQQKQGKENYHILISNGLISFIHNQTHKLRYEKNTEDYFYRIGQMARANLTRHTLDKRREKWLKILQYLHKKIEAIT